MVIISVEELENIIRKIFFEVSKYDQLKIEMDKAWGSYSSPKKEEIIEEKKESSEKKELTRLTHKQAAKTLGVSETTLTKWRYAGLVPFYQLKARGTVFYYREELQDHFKQEPRLKKYVRK